MYKLAYSDSVVTKDIPRLSMPVKALIRSQIEKKLLSDPVRFGKPLRYDLKGCRSLRVGDYRVIYQIQDRIIRILVIRHRKNSYEAPIKL